MLSKTKIETKPKKVKIWVDYPEVHEFIPQSSETVLLKLVKVLIEHLCFAIRNGIIPREYNGDGVVDVFSANVMRTELVDKRVTLDTKATNAIHDTLRAVCSNVLPTLAAVARTKDLQELTLNKGELIIVLTSEDIDDEAA